MDTYNALLKRRTIRRFLEKTVSFEALEKCVEAARLAPSARNTQELEFIVVNNAEKLEQLNKAVRFGGVVAEKGRVKGEEPKAFIAIIANKEKSDEAYTSINVGIAAQTIVLTSFEQGLGTCMLGAIERDQIKEILGIPESYSLPLVIALGYPKETPVTEEAKENNLRYWIDKKGVLHVPKRAIENVLHRNEF
ncbi:MAG: nitroreductase family protein [archaeon]|jgi:nitroreductase|nr:nitroreductase family protein [archaeon]